jgi:hypothetical protein
MLLLLSLLSWLYIFGFNNVSMTVEAMQSRTKTRLERLDDMSLASPIARK